MKKTLIASLLALSSLTASGQTLFKFMNSGACSTTLSAKYGFDGTHYTGSIKLLATDPTYYVTAGACSSNCKFYVYPLYGSYTSPMKFTNDPVNPGYITYVDNKEYDIYINSCKMITFYGTSSPSSADGSLYDISASYQIKDMPEPMPVF